MPRPSDRLGCGIIMLTLLIDALIAWYVVTRL